MWDGDLIPLKRWPLVTATPSGVTYTIAILQAEARSEFNTSQYNAAMKYSTNMINLDPQGGMNRKYDVSSFITRLRWDVCRPSYDISLQLRSGTVATHQLNYWYHLNTLATGPNGSLAFLFSFLRVQDVCNVYVPLPSRGAAVSPPGGIRVGGPEI